MYKLIQPAISYVIAFSYDKENSYVRMFPMSKNFDYIICDEDYTIINHSEYEEHNTMFVKSKDYGTHFIEEDITEEDAFLKML
jgi:hypothetical protein